jgi:hypothetical protein
MGGHSLTGRRSASYRWCRLVAVVLVGVLAGSIPAGDAGAALADPAATGTLVHVLDGDGNPFPIGTAAVMATPTAPGGSMTVFSADADGNAWIVLDPTVEYNLTAFATNTGWPNPWVNPDDGTEFHFSAPLIILGADLVEGTTFTVANPANPIPTGTLVHVLDGDGNPFPAGTASVMAIPTAGGDNIVATANAAGDAWIELERADHPRPERRIRPHRLRHQHRLAQPVDRS